MCETAVTTYLQELSGFYDALDEMQDGVLQMAKTPASAASPLAIQVYVAQMFDLGLRLERLFCLLHDEPLRIMKEEAERPLNERPGLENSLSISGSVLCNQGGTLSANR